jgi:hypothetical protein
MVFGAANGVNVLVAALFVVRWRGFERAEYAIGLAVIAMIVPAGAAAALNAAARREWWTVVLPLVLAAYLLAELLLDYVFQIPFRETALLWPYIVLFYAGLWGMIGYSFLMGKPFGAVTLVTYFVQLGVMIFTHAKGGLHGGPTT